MEKHLLFVPRYTVNEVLNILEQDDNWQEADIFLSPPDDGHASDEDSADEEVTIPSINNLSRNQLLADAMAVIRVGAERKELCDTFDDSGGECVSDTVMPDSDEVSTHITITDSHCKNAEEPEPTLARTRVSG